jgi:nucleotide-binding universal stress UspA family protein
MLNALLRQKSKLTIKDAGFNRILVPVDVGKVDAGAIDLACRLAGCKDKKTIIAVHVIHVERCLPLDAEINNALGAAEALMSTVEKQVEKLEHLTLTDILQSRDVGYAVVQASRDYRAELILLTVNSRVHLGQFCLGNPVNYILKNAPCRVILNYEAEGWQE